jgi:hypothetical protein
MAQREWTKTFVNLPILTAAAVVSAFPCLQLAQNSGPGASPSSFAGTWTGICQDGQPFVVLTLKVSGQDLAGEIRMANMSGDNGQCAAVVDPPSPEHAIKISGAKPEGKTLRFVGAQKLRFEMSLDGAQTATLKLIGTPVEETPWQLKRSAE